MTARPSRARSERLSRLSRAALRWSLTHWFMAWLNSAGEAWLGRLQMSLVTLPSTILNGSSLPTFSASAASR